MTKEEYRQLLNSDYWKGYSYSLIKERNFTCEDCGRRFFGQRNKLQVHHLRYRDANPWSYSPDELVVLCDACHRKRHRLYSDVDDKKEYDNIETTTETELYDKLLNFVFSKRGVCCLVCIIIFLVVSYNYLNRQPDTQEEKTEQVDEINKKKSTQHSRGKKSHKKKKRMSEQKEEKNIDNETDDFVQIEENGSQEKENEIQSTMPENEQYNE